MTLSQTPGAVKRFRRIPWRFQQTFQTPLKNLPPFVKAIVTTQEPLSAACISIDQVVFEPKNLIRLLSDHFLPAEYGHDWSVTVSGSQEVESLLQAALSDWVDFTFVPIPKPFVIYADHDEYVTFYANRKSNLNRLLAELSKQGFKKVQDYERQL